VYYALYMAYLKVGKEDCHESKIICKTDLRKMQGHQEKRENHDHL